MSYTAGLGPLGRLCQAGCGEKLPKTLNEAGIEAHPCCGPSELSLLRANKRPAAIAGEKDAGATPSEQNT